MPRLPHCELAGRDVRTGGCWYGNGSTTESTNATVLASHLRSCRNHYGVEMREVKIKTHNGSEFIGGMHKKGERAFKEVANAFGVRHCRI